MQFNSYIFILLFLPLTLIGYFTLNRWGREKLSKEFLLIMSLWFYGYFNVYYLFIICGSILVNYVVFLMMKTPSFRERGKRKALLTAGIVFNVAVIFYFKYYDFFLENLNALFKTNFVLMHIVLPLGISFFTFQQISFVVDAYKGECDDYGFLEYALFVTFFPQLVAGPIVLHSELIPQFKDKNRWQVNFDNLSRGVMLFTRGLAKKVLIADIFGNAVNWGFSQAAIIAEGEGALTIPEILIVMVSYTFQIYFDFSGYSDMATGLAAMLNLELPMNFDSPYKAISVADFWKRWHMTLTRFLTRYVYIPLGGSRKGKLRTYLNTMIVFLVSGIWHGANWTFILWGVLHGLAQCFNKMTHGLYVSIIGSIKKGPAGKVFTAIVKGLCWFVTFIFVNVTWLLFRADSVTMWTQLLRRLFVLNLDVRTELVEAFRIPKLTALLAGLGAESSDFFVLSVSTVVFMVLALIICLVPVNNYRAEYRKNAFNLVATVVLLTLCVISLSSVSTFLYFNF